MSIYTAYGSSLSPSLEGLSYGTANAAIDPAKTHTTEARGAPPVWTGLALAWRRWRAWARRRSGRAEEVAAGAEPAGAGRGE